MKKFILVLSLLVIVFCSCDLTTNTRKPSKIDEDQEVNDMIKCNPTLVSNDLPDVVDEQSGMIWHNNLIWVNNDSGGEAKLYAYNKVGELKQSLQIENAENQDWEALAEDENYFYIGEFGNNKGNRKNLKLFRVDKTAIGNDPKISVKADEISFNWADQKEFKSKKHNHNYDCEAFFSYGDSLYFFTKNWENRQTRMYVMPKSNGHHELYPKAEFDVGFLVTGADINPSGSTMALVGYKNYKTYMMLFYDFVGSDYFSGKHVRLDLSVLGGAQTEGVLFTDNDELYISTEATKQKQAIYQINWKQWIK